jgi:hypothetical protein
MTNAPHPYDALMDITAPRTNTAWGRAVMSISASYGWGALVMSNSSMGGDEKTREKQEGRTLRVRPSRKLC